MHKRLTRQNTVKEPLADPEGSKAAGMRLRLFRLKILKLDTIAELGIRLGEMQENRVGNWERGSPYHKHALKIAKLRPGLNPYWFHSGKFDGTASDVMRDILAAEEEATAEGWYRIAASS